MKRHICTAILVLLTAFFAYGCSSEPDHDYFVEQFKISIADSDKLKALLREITIAIKEHSNDAKLINMRIAINQTLEDLPAVRADAEMLVTLFPDSPEMLLRKCMYDEEDIGKNSETIQCYKDVLTLYDKENPPDKAKRLGYSLAALFAEIPEAQSIRERYLQELGHSPVDELNRELITNFSREAFFKTQSHTIER